MKYKSSKSELRSVLNAIGQQMIEQYDSDTIGSQLLTLEYQIELQESEEIETFNRHLFRKRYARNS